MSWLRFGPLAVYIEPPSIEIPWPWPVFRSRYPGAARWLVRLSLNRAPQAGEDGPLRWNGQAFTGPGFRLTRGGSCYRAQVETPVACMGALAAALVDQSADESFVLVHGALVSVGDCGVLVLGPSGAGKSTLARRLGRRVLGSNAALLWEHRGRVWASPLPITGHGDAAVAARSVRLVGAWMLDRDEGANTPATRVARWLGALAGAKGKAPAVGWSWRLAQTVPLGPLRQGFSSRNAPGTFPRSSGVESFASSAKKRRPFLD